MANEIPNEAFVVRTANSIYRFGEADKDDSRFVSRDDRPLDFSQCTILKLERGETMELECHNAPHPRWYTTTVISIDTQD